jgi:hypoxanthine-DNA glycosylase
MKHRKTDAPDPTAACFAPAGDRHAWVLILGSMPGVASLRAGQYYAHPRNVFWTIMGDLVGAAPGLPYLDRLAILRSSGIALWDALAHCVRPGSLDSAITDETANDFAGFFAAHRAIARVIFNGAKAQQSFLRHVDPAQLPPGLELRRLPSTSPANAGMPLKIKLQTWREALADPAPPLSASC